MTVCTGFCVAGYLIQDSYADWQASPVSTSIETKPLKDLTFPTVTVCSPPGSNTALNYDLMKASDDSLNDSSKEALKQAAFDVFILESHNIYIKAMVAAANPSNLKSIFDGYQTAPVPYVPYGNSGLDFTMAGFEHILWNNFGAFQTSGFGETYDKDSYESNTTVNMILEFPEGLSEQVGSGSLVIQLEVDTREEEGWREEVQYRDGGPKKYTLHKEIKTWYEAESQCQSEGGHLASIVTKEEWQQVMTVAAGEYKVWLGGTEEQEEGRWRWADGSQWRYQMEKVKRTAWAGTDNDCLQMNLFSERWMEDQYCTYNNPFICQTFGHTMTGNHSLRLEYSQEQFIFPYFQVLYSYQVSSTHLTNSWQPNRIGGFRISWFIQVTNRTNLTETIGSVIKSISAEVTPGIPSNTTKYVNLFQLVTLASKARNQGMTRKEIIVRTLEEKAAILRSGSLQCWGGQVAKVDYHMIFDKVTLGMNAVTSVVSITDEDIMTGFSVYSALVYCGESVPLYQFLQSLLSTQSARTVIKATVNSIQETAFKDRETRKRLNHFYAALQDTLDLQYGAILLATISRPQLEQMIAKDWPYFRQYTSQVEECLHGDSCQGVMDIIGSFGNIHLKINTSCLRCREWSQ